MTQDQNHIDYHLLGKYLSGEATPEEAITVDEWLHLPANKKQFDEIEKIWNGLPGDTRHQLPDRMAAWNELQPLLPVKRKANVVRLFSRRNMVAAGVLVVIVGALWFFTKMNGKTTDDKEWMAFGPVFTILRDSLPDGSNIVLQQNSVLRYSKDFNNSSRDLQLQGEAYFNVAHNEEKPFIIEVGNLKIRVIGTAFNVKQTTNPATVEVQVKSGLVKMYTSKNELNIAKGQTGIYVENQDAFTLKDTINVNSISYATREFSFYNMHLADVIAHLQHAYGVAIEVKNKKILNCMLTGYYAEPEVGNILQVIAVTFKLNYTKEGNTYYLDGDGCD
jgi:transmembrane sensor